MVSTIVSVASFAYYWKWTTFLFLANYQQKKQLQKIQSFLQKTTYFTTYNPSQKISSYKEFSSQFPIVRYEHIAPLITTMMEGSPNILTPGITTDFAKSSGTTNAKSKFIPLTKKSLLYNHFSAGADVFAWAVHTYKAASIVNGTTLSITGSFSHIPEYPAIRVGDISAFLSSSAAHWTQKRQFPANNIRLLPHWEEKKNAIVAQAEGADVRAIFGTPTWTLRILEGITASGKKVSEVWPHFKLFIHGAVGFEPYKKSFLQLTEGLSVDLLEAYNATEGFFAFGTEKTNGLFLLTKHGIFYEFVEKKYWDTPEKNAIPLWEVQTNVPYALVITTYNGLIRYMVGDVISFTSTAPYKIKILGRTKHFINGFGEEVLGSQLEQAISEAAEVTQSIVHAFTVAPLHTDNGKGVHVWLVAFEKNSSPRSLEAFTEQIDTVLMSINSDYEAKRAGILEKPRIIITTPEQFHSYLEKNKKLGGQHKIPTATSTTELISAIYPEWIS